MDLKTLIAVLLPRQSREAILGDLEERGFRLADAATVIPAAWWNHITRSPLFLSNVPLMDRAQAFRAQVERRNILAFTMSGAVLGFLNGGHYREASLRRLFAVVVSFSISLMGTILVQRFLCRGPRTTDEWVAAYRDQLRSQRKMAAWGFPVSSVAAGALQATQELWPETNTNNLLLRTAYSAGTLLISVAICWPRANRLRRELQRLEITKRT